MTRAIILSIAIFLFLSASNARGEDLQDLLNATCINKVYMLRHAITRESQHYDSAGQLLDYSATEGPWTIYGALEIKSVTLSSNRLRLTANRLVYSYDQGKKDLIPGRITWNKAKVTLDVALSHPVTTIEEVDGIFHRIFALNDTELIETVPDYWRPFLQKRASGTSSTTAAGVTEVKKDSTEAIERINPPDVTAPKPIHTPEPKFSSFARDFRMQGTVVLTIIVDKTGAVSRPEIVLPAGFGFDEAAATGVLSWKFKPAMRDGNPVAVHMAIEVAFNLR